MIDVHSLSFAHGGGSFACLLGRVTDVMGLDRVMLGSNYPFPLGEQRIGQLVGDAPMFSAAQSRQLLRGNAEAFFGLLA